MANHKRYLVVPDLHVPFHDRSFVKLINKQLSENQYDGMVQIGDAMDFYQLSRFDKDPDRKFTVKDEIESYRKILLKWQGLLHSKAKFWQLEGNHEDRFRRYLWSNAGALRELVRDTPDELGIKDMPLQTFWCEYEHVKACVLGDLIIHHGTYYGKHLTRSNVKDHYKCKFMQGHSHRSQYYYENGIWSASIGCGADITKVMHEAKLSDWVQMFAEVYVSRGIANVILHRVKEGKVIYVADYSQEDRSKTIYITWDGKVDS